MFLPETDT